MRRSTPFFLLIFLFSACAPNPHREGERLYKKICANCHLDDGQGLAGLIPPLAQSDYLANHRQQLPCIIRRGLADTIRVNGRTYAEQMAGNPELSAIQITNIINYMHEAWGNALPPFRLGEVDSLLRQCGRYDQLH